MQRRRLRIWRSWGQRIRDWVRRRLGLRIRPRRRRFDNVLHIPIRLDGHRHTRPVPAFADGKTGSLSPESFSSPPRGGESPAIGPKSPSPRGP